MTHLWEAGLKEVREDPLDGEQGTGESPGGAGCGEGPVCN